MNIKKVLLSELYLSIKENRYFFEKKSDFSNNFVPGEGELNSPDICFIGEAP